MTNSSLLDDTKKLLEDLKKNDQYIKSQISDPLQNLQSDINGLEKKIDQDEKDLNDLNQATIKGLAEDATFRIAESEKILED